MTSAPDPRNPDPHDSAVPGPDGRDSAVPGPDGRDPDGRDPQGRDPQGRHPGRGLWDATAPAAPDSAAHDPDTPGLNLFDLDPRDLEHGRPAYPGAPASAPSFEDEIAAAVRYERGLAVKALVALYLVALVLAFRVYFFG